MHISLCHSPCFPSHHLQYSVSLPRHFIFNPRVASWGGGVIYPKQTRFFHHCTKTAWIFWTLPWLFLDIGLILATKPPKIFPYLLLSPKFWWETKGQRAPQMVKNWFQAYLWLGMPQVEKSDGYIHVFMCSQASGSSGNFSWRHMQAGSRNPPKPEVVISRRREDSSTWSQRPRHTFGACPIHFHLRRPRPTMENTIRCKPEVETVSQTESTINLATERDIDVMSVSIPMFWGARFSLVYMPTSPDAFFTQKVQDGGRIPEVVITLRRKMISLLSQQLRHSFRARPIHLHWRRHRLTMENTIS